MSILIKDNIYWVGAIDWNLRDFHGYVTGRGATYNSYLILDDKITLVDTVKSTLLGDLLANISHLVDPQKIDYLICNHIEKDHSSSIPDLMRIAPNVKIFATKMARIGLNKYYGNLPIETVKTGDILKLGKKVLQFIEIPMIHWPDSMMSYIPQDGLLLSNDAFGQHIATSKRFDDEVNRADVMYEAGKYFANLLTHLAPLIQNALNKIDELKLSIDMIAPSHGVIWRSFPGDIIAAYRDWCSFTTREKVLIIYDTMWQATETIAKILLDTIINAGIDAKLLKLRETHRSDVMSELLDARGLFLGSPTIHRTMFPTVADLVCYMQGLKPQKKIAAAFGSFGWSGEAVPMLTDALKNMDLSVIEPGIKVQYMPDSDDKERIRTFASDMIARIKHQ
ncbi:MAG: FprA family A-type flavoprotein [Desulfobacterota bacterium]|nr:FprA family A-type flavoprotein [Thermodesulfobacteriota bacterium]